MNIIQKIDFNHYKKPAAIIVGILVTLLIIVFIERDTLLNYYVKKKVANLEQEDSLTIHYEGLHMEGLAQVQITNVSIVPIKRDTLLRIKHAAVDLSLWKLLRLTPSVRNIDMDGLAVTFVKKGNQSNYDFLFRKKKNNEEEHHRDYASKVRKLMEVIFNTIPSNGQMTNTLISVRRNNNYAAVSLPEMKVNNNKYSIELKVQADGKNYTWLAEGVLNPDDKEIEASISSIDGGKIELPYIHRLSGAKVSFNRVSFKLSEETFNGEVTLSGIAKAEGLSLYHPAISPNMVNLDNGSVDYVINVGDDYFELDRQTEVRFNFLTFNPYIKAEKKDKKWHITMAIDKPTFPANELFSSLPQGLFQNLDGIKVMGDLSYHFLLDIDFDNLNTLKFESSLTPYNFHITKFGETNLGKMNAPFLYTAYDNGKPVRTFMVGPANPNYRSLDSISRYLQVACMESEDGLFFRHQGFRMDALRNALICDLKAKKFVRGGSTISMQLVKNVFLNKNKNLLRKLEEAIIVWLIENDHVTSKSRMYEVYLNICEWAPRVYGANEAAQFYFSKDASQLTPEEAIFLASIIPKPKHYRSEFTADGQLRGYLAGYFRLIAKYLRLNGLITPEQEDSIRPIIHLGSRARKGFGTALPDSTMLQDSIPNNLINAPSIDDSANPTNPGAILPSLPIK
jgi:hypothetical protein